MKIFISHSSKNKNYGEKLVELLRSLGIKENEIIFTSNIAYGIPVGQNIFNWLKSQISEKPFVIYLLSEEYYESVACLNEMGAAWIIENQHASVFTPNFNLSSKEFQSGALDPREIGFYINENDRILSFVQVLSEYFELTKNSILISQSVEKFIKEVKNIENSTKKIHEVLQVPPIEKGLMIQTPEANSESEATNRNLQISKIGLYSKFLDFINSKKVKDDELILLHYIIETGRFKLMTGWKESDEIASIKEWEKINDISRVLSINYSSVLKRYEIRGFIEVSAFTYSNYPKEVKIKDDIQENLLDLPSEISEIIYNAVQRNYFEHKEEMNINNFDVPF
ncbi:toll/interleukin-1 receptor domain-containing protein [Arcicella sp. DC2W]|uniref:Toll/interleukin-1 receptor domain-containing protein n=1 Tax=Arcicella gelida TaxID=2984195 RepID=A0ABU5SAP0_9BACT|nr:toll/interleukin-1 receptor domain-containing protein [Arcicella sp. DC2W]MEA5405530.1 toll/interleukin-1 receptor domain-containing protein [Arcicella sp. DC2W]